jgi:hypothetical protein
MQRFEYGPLKTTSIPLLKPVEVSGRYSNHADQEKRIGEVLRFELARSPEPKTQTLRRSQRRLSGDELESLLKSYEQGTRVNLLANQFGIHRSTVMDHLNRSSARRRYPALDMKGIETAKQLYGTGLSLRDVGILLEVHASTVGTVLRNAGVPLRDQQGRCR